MRLASSEHEAEVHLSAPRVARGSSEDSNDGMDETFASPEVARLNLKTLGLVAGADKPVSPPDSVRRTGSESRDSKWQVQHRRGPDSLGGASPSENEKSVILSEAGVSIVLR